MTTLGLEPATFWLVAQSLNQLRCRMAQDYVNIPPNYCFALSPTIRLYRKLTVKRFISTYERTNERTPWPESASELYRPSDRSLSAK
jgi:hypothetical protein